MPRLPVGSRRDDRKPVSGCRRDIDVGRRIVVERDTKHLSNLRRGKSEGLGCAHELRGRRPAHMVEIDHTQRRPVQVNEGLFPWINSRRDLNRCQGAGEASDGSIA